MPHVYGLDSKSLDLLGIASNIARELAAPNAAAVDAQARFPEEAIRALGERGFWGLCLPTSVGGLGQAPRTFAAVAEELATACASTAMVFVMHTSAAAAIAASTTLTNRDALLKDIAAGKHFTTLALSEKGSRSQFWAPVSKLSPAGAGFNTDAQKSWVTSADRADSYVSSAQKPDAQSPLESTVYFVRRGAKGVRTASRFDGLGLRGNDSSPVTIEGASIAKDDLMTDLGAGAKMMLEVVLPWFAVGSAAMAAGLCRAAVGATAKHLSEAGFDHLGGSKLRDLLNLRMRLAEMSMRTDATRGLIAYTVGEMEQPNAMTPLYVLEARLAGIEAALEVTDLAMKTCGGAAFSKHLPIERLFRDARAGWVMAPTADHLKDFIGKALTGLPLF